MHLDELEVLAFVEGGRDDLREHVGACAVCAGAVREQEAARELLRASGLLVPPPLAPVVATLPGRAPRRLTGWPRLAAIAAPLAVGAVAVAIVSGRGEGGPQPSAGQSEAATALQAPAAPQADAKRSAAPPSLESAGDPVVRSVAGPRARVERRLRAAGLDVAVEDGVLYVHGTRRQVTAALRGLPAGPVRVVLR
jgi:hypothetical protein